MLSPGGGMMERIHVRSFPLLLRYLAATASCTPRHSSGGPACYRPWPALRHDSRERLPMRPHLPLALLCALLSTISASAQLRLTHPNGNNVYIAGDTVAITW